MACYVTVMFLKSCAMHIEGSALSFLLRCDHQHLLLSLHPGLPGQGKYICKGFTALAASCSFFSY